METIDFDSLPLHSSSLFRSFEEVKEGQIVKINRKNFMPNAYFGNQFTAKLQGDHIKQICQNKFPNSNWVENPNNDFATITFIK